MADQDYSPPSSSSRTPCESPSSSVRANVGVHRHHPDLHRQQQQQRFFLNHHGRRAHHHQYLNSLSVGAGQLYRQLAKASRPLGSRGTLLHQQHPQRNKPKHHNHHGGGGRAHQLPESVCEFVCGYKRRLVIDIDLEDPRIQRRSWPNSMFQPRSHDECRWYVFFFIYSSERTGLCSALLRCWCESRLVLSRLRSTQNLPRPPGNLLQN